MVAEHLDPRRAQVAGRLDDREVEPVEARVQRQEHVREVRVREPDDDRRDPVVEYPERGVDQPPAHERAVDHAARTEHQDPRVRPDEVHREERQEDEEDDDLEQPPAAPRQQVRQREREREAQKRRHGGDNVREPQRRDERCVPDRAAAVEQGAVVVQRRLVDDLVRQRADLEEAHGDHERQRRDEQGEYPRCAGTDRDAEPTAWSAQQPHRPRPRALVRLVCGHLCRLDLFPRGDVRLLDVRVDVLERVHPLEPRGVDPPVQLVLLLGQLVGHVGVRAGREAGLRERSAVLRRDELVNHLPGGLLVVRGGRDDRGLVPRQRAFFGGDVLDPVVALAPHLDGLVPPAVPDEEVALTELLDERRVGGDVPLQPRLLLDEQILDLRELVLRERHPRAGHRVVHAEVQRRRGDRLRRLVVHDDLAVEVGVDVIGLEQDVVARLVVRHAPGVVGVAVPAEADRHAVGVPALRELVVDERLEPVVHGAVVVHHVVVHRRDEVGVHEPRHEVVVRDGDVELLVLAGAPLREHLRRRRRGRDVQLHPVERGLDVLLHLGVLLPRDDVDRGRPAAAHAPAVAAVAAVAAVPAVATATPGESRHAGGARAGDVAPATHAPAGGGDAVVRAMRSVVTV